MDEAKRFETRPIEQHEGFRFEEERSSLILTIENKVFSSKVISDLLVAVRERKKFAPYDKLVITGVADVFSLGGDVREFADSKDLPKLVRQMAQGFAEIVKELAQESQPIVTIVNGPAAGVGLSLAEVGDYIIATSAAKFVAGYKKIGLSEDGGLSYFLPRRIGESKARRMVQENQFFDAEQALEIGLVDAVAEDIKGAKSLLASQRVEKRPIDLGALEKCLVNEVIEITRLTETGNMQDIVQKFVGEK